MIWHTTSQSVFCPLADSHKLVCERDICPIPVWNNTPCCRHGSRWLKVLSDSLDQCHCCGDHPLCIPGRTLLLCHESSLSALKLALKLSCSYPKRPGAAAMPLLQVMLHNSMRCQVAIGTKNDFMASYRRAGVCGTKFSCKHASS